MANSGRAKTLMKAFGRRLVACRVMAGYDDAEGFAKILEIEGPAYRKYERGDSFPPLDLLERIVMATGASVDFLIFGRPLGSQEKT